MNPTSMADLTELPIDIREEILAFTTSRVITNDSAAIIIGPLGTLLYCYYDEPANTSIRVAPNAKLIGNCVEYDFAIKMAGYGVSASAVDVRHIIFAIARGGFAHIKEYSAILPAVSRAMHRMDMPFNYVECGDSPNADLALRLGRLPFIMPTDGLKLPKLVEIKHVDFASLAPLMESVEAEKVVIGDLMVLRDRISVSTASRIKSIDTVIFSDSYNRVFNSRDVNALARLSRRVDIIINRTDMIFSIDCKVIKFKPSHVISGPQFISAQRVAETIYLNEEMLDFTCLRVSKECSVRAVYCNRQIFYDKEQFVERPSDVDEYLIMYVREDTHALEAYFPLLARFVGDSAGRVMWPGGAGRDELD